MDDIVVASSFEVVVVDSFEDAVVVVDSSEDAVVVVDLSETEDHSDTNSHSKSSVPVAPATILLIHLPDPVERCYV